MSHLVNLSELVLIPSQTIVTYHLVGGEVKMKQHPMFVFVYGQYKIARAELYMGLNMYRRTSTWENVHQ